MTKVIFTSASGDVVAIDTTPGDSVMETAVRNGVSEIVAECGGSLSCATCHVFVHPEDLSTLPVIEEMEDEMLWGTAVDRQENSRLSCQLRVNEGCTIRVTTPETQI